MHRIYDAMTISSFVVLLLTVAETCLAVLHLFEVRGTLHGEGALKLTDRGSRSVLAFVAHYFFSVFVLGTTCMATEASVFLDSVGVSAKTARLVCFGGLVALTLVFFI